MSLVVQNNTILNYIINFEVDGELVHPSSATITLTNNAGSVVGSINDSSVTIAANATSATYTFSGANNTSSLDYELRFVLVKFVYNSKTYYIRDFYTIRSSLNIPVTPNDVRLFAGLSSTELSDDQIDIYSAYDELNTDVTEANLDTLITSGSELIPYIQVGVKAKAAMNSLSVIESVMYQSEQADNTIYKRFAKIDFNAILDRFRNVYNNAVVKLNGGDLGASESVTVFIVSTGIDPVTNA